MSAQCVDVSALVLILAGILFVQHETIYSALQKPRPPVDVKSRLQDRTFESESLSRPMKYRILLPAHYSETGNYPVLYLLHGWHGDFENWSTLTKLAHYAEDLPVIIVMPDAGDSWYANSASNPTDKFERYIAHDLIEEVDQHWRTLRSPDRRAIAGLSMGGYGALKFALKYPQMFRLAASMSGAFNATSTDLASARPDLQPSLRMAFGSEDRETRKQNDVYVLAVAATSQPMPYLYLDCGNEDSSFLEANRKMAAILSQRKLAYEYHEYPGAHDWQYWDERLPEVLSVVRREIVERSPW